MNDKISLALRLQFTKFGLMDMSVWDIIGIIRTGDFRLVESGYGYALREITEAIRREPDPQKQNDWKERFLPVAFFNGKWDGQKISEYSSITAIDFDHIGTEQQLQVVLGGLKSSPFVLAVFKTFKPRRIKALVLHDNLDPSKHKEMYEQLIRFFGITSSGIDTSCKDLSRKTFLPWDEDIWVNSNYQPYHFAPKTSTPVTTRTKSQSTGKAKSPQSIINILNSSWEKNHPEYWQPGNRATSIFKCACQLCEYGVPGGMAEDYFATGGWIADDFTEDEVFKHVRGAYSYNKDRFGSKIFI